MRPRLSAVSPAFSSSSGVGHALPAGGVHHGVGGDLLAAFQGGDGPALVAPRPWRPSRRSGTSPTGRAGGTSAPRRSRRRRSRASCRAARSRSPGVPSAANIDAYSMPMTPAPTTTIESGIRSRLRMPSESTMRFSSKSTCSGAPAWCRSRPRCARRVTCRSARPSGAQTATVWASTKLANPCRSSTWLRNSWLRMISISRPITCWVRDEQVLDGDVALDPVARAVQIAHVEAGQVDDGLAQRLGRDGAGVDADAAHHLAALDHGGTLGRASRPRSRPSVHRARTR